MSIEVVQSSLTATRAEERPAWLSLQRDELFCALYVVACANGLLGRFIQAIHADSALASALSVDINAVVFFACFAGLSMMFSSARQGVGTQQIGKWDVALAAVFLILVALPIYPLSWIAVTGLSIYIVLFASDNPDRVRGAIILFALAVPMFWSRLLFQMFAKTILDIDALLVATVLDSSRAGNMVRFVDGSGYMIVLAPCSSLANMSLAFLCWISISQWVRHSWSKIDLLWSGLACLSVVAVNVTRISLMGLGQSWYTAIHNQWGDLVTNTIMLILMVTFSLIGARREIFARI
ncbi:MAG TPA: hypothetical protein VNK51_09400 [Bradyrhizobium sp.]|nr:hypothetical protein [Bradyrhizobium sp.]